ncbi:MAG: cyanase, partial [Lysobacterales bacterium]
TGTRMNRNDVTEKIITVKVSKGITWESVAKKVGLSKEWTTAACLGQMTLEEKQAKVVGKIFGLTVEEQKWLQVAPYKGSLPTPVPTDPLIYRWYEIVSVYGTTIKELGPVHPKTGVRKMNAGMQCKARGVPCSTATQASRNAAMRPAFIFPFGLAGFPASALSGGLQIAMLFAAPPFAHPSGNQANASPVLV